jgi:hypothetical protein
MSHIKSFAMLAKALIAGSSRALGEKWRRTEELPSNRPTFVGATDLNRAMRLQIAYSGTYSESRSTHRMTGETRAFVHPMGIVWVQSVCFPDATDCSRTESLLDIAEATVMD